MKKITSQTNTSQNNPIEIIVPEAQDGWESSNSTLDDFHTPDSYDAHITSAETAARKEREGVNFKHLHTHITGPNNIDTSDGFTVDKEGLIDNFSIEPEMYYQKRGDLPDSVKQNKLRQQEIHQAEIHQAEIQKFEARQVEIQQEEARQAEIRREKTRQNVIRQEEARQEQVRQQEILQDKARQDKALQAKTNPELTKLGIGTFSTYEATEIALVELKENGFVMDRVSLVGRDIKSHTEVTGARTSNRLADFDNLDTNENQAGGTAIDGAIGGITIGGFAGLLVGLGLLVIPGVGPVMMAGAAATALATAISGGAIGGMAGGLAGGLVGLGIPSDRAKLYSDRIADGDYLVIVEGSETDLNKAESIFSKHDIDQWYIYDSASESEQTVTTTKE